MKLKNLFKTKKNWIQYDLAEDSHGNSVDEWAENAVSWCLLGGIRKCYDSSDPIIDKIVKELEADSVFDLVDWNNNKNRKFSDIKRLVDKLDI